MRVVLIATVAALAFVGDVSATSIAATAKYVRGTSTSSDLFITSPWATEGSSSDGKWSCARPISDDSKSAECCIAVNDNGTGDIKDDTPGTNYGRCKSSTSHNCPGSGTKKTCTASMGNGGCPDTFSGVYPKCQMADSECMGHIAQDHGIHCWGTIQCYSDEAGTSKITCPGDITFNGGIYKQGDFCYESGVSGVTHWCGAPLPTCPDGSPYTGQDCDCQAPFEIIGGICCATIPGSGVCTNPAPTRGDPQIGGFHGQSFQFHGLADEVFNLISSPSLQVNGHFVYLSSGKCDYNDTMCWTHPGTYIDQLGFKIGSHQVKIVAGTHTKGLHMSIDGDEIARGNYQFQTNQTAVEIKYHHHGTVHIKTHDFAFNVHNSDMFFNFETSLLDQHLLRIGAPKHTVTDSALCKKEETVDETKFHQHNHGAVEAAIQKKYGGIEVPLHGLIGQTWRNVIVCGKHWVGAVSDYVASDLFASDYFFNFFSQ